MCAVANVIVALTLVSLLMMDSTISKCTTQHDLRVKHECRTSQRLLNEDRSVAYKVKTYLTHFGTRCLPDTERPYIISRAWTPEIFVTPKGHGRHWKLDISLELMPSMKPGKYLLEVVSKFAPRFREDNCTTICLGLEVEELSPDRSEAHYVHIRCLQVLAGRTWTIKLKFGNKNPQNQIENQTYQHSTDISTQCSCDNQKTIISNDTCSVSFAREPWVTHYAIKTEVGSTLVPKTEIKLTNQTMIRDDLSRSRALRSNGTVKLIITYYCTDVETRKCKTETLPLKCQSPQALPSRNNNSHCNGFFCGQEQLILVVVLSLVLLVIITIVIFVIYRRRAANHMNSQPNNAEQQSLLQEIECTMLYHAATDKDKQAVEIMVNMLRHSYISAKCCPSLKSVDEDVMADWRQVGEKIGKNSKHIILIMSAGISSLCAATHSDEDSETLEQRLLERQEENIPGVVLDTLRTPGLQSYTHLHLVSFDCSTMTESALPFFRRESSCIQTMSSIYCVNGVVGSSGQQTCSCQPTTDGLSIFDFKSLVNNIRMDELS